MTDPDRLRRFKAGPLQEIKTVTSSGILVVVTGHSGAGKDTLAENYLRQEEIARLEFNRLVTCASRPMRSNEKHGREYFFHSEGEMMTMWENGELVEKPLWYRDGYKATPKREFKDIIAGSKKLWRIDPSLAKKVADGSFFDEQFPNEAQILKEVTLVFCVDASSQQVLEQLRVRDGSSFVREKYVRQHKQDQEYIDALMQTAIVINNVHQMPEVATNQMVKHTLNHHEKLKKKD